MSLKKEKEECAKSTFRCGETMIFDIWINENQDTLRKPRAPSVYIYIYMCVATYPCGIQIEELDKKKRTGNDTLQPKFCRINERQIWTWFRLAPETYQANIFIRQ